MSTASTIVIKRPNREYPDKHGSMKKYSMNFMVICLWGLAAIIAATNAEISPNVTGISVTIKTQDVLIMLATTYMLGKGLRQSNYLLVIPWILLSVWNIYHIHFTSSLKMCTVLKQTKTLAKLPWIGLSIDLLALLMRILLIIRVAHLALKQWCNRKLANEMRHKQ